MLVGLLQYRRKKMEKRETGTGQNLLLVNKFVIKLNKYKKYLDFFLTLKKQIFLRLMDKNRLGRK